ncbi:hypothetical protein FOL47_000745, partial [Perkinsus chesapeaki]
MTKLSSSRPRRAPGQGSALTEMRSLLEPTAETINPHPSQRRITRRRRLAREANQKAKGERAKEGRIGRDRLRVLLRARRLNRIQNSSNPTEGGLVNLLSAHTRKPKSQKDSLHVGTWNVRSLKSSGRIMDLHRVMVQYNLDICCIVETHLGTDFISPMALPDGSVFYNAGPDAASGQARQGTGFRVSARIAPKVRSHTSYGLRNSKLTLEAMAVNLTDYFPTESGRNQAANEDAQEERERDEYMVHLEALNRAVSDCGNDWYLIGADVNCKLAAPIEGEADPKYWPIGQCFRGSETSLNGDKLIEFLRDHELQVLNSFFKHKKVHTDTWVHPRASLGISRPMDSWQNGRVYRGADIVGEIGHSSDHYLVVGTRRKLEESPSSECFKRHFEALFEESDRRPNPPLLGLPRRDYSHLDDPPTKEEIENVFKTMKTKKCPGISGITPEMVKAVGSPLYLHLQKLFTKIFETAEDCIWNPARMLSRPRSFLVTLHIVLHDWKMVLAEKGVAGVKFIIGNSKADLGFDTDAEEEIQVQKGEFADDLSDLQVALDALEQVGAGCLFRISESKTVWVPLSEYGQQDGHLHLRGEPIAKDKVTRDLLCKQTEQLADARTFVAV